MFYPSLYSAVMHSICCVTLITICTTPCLAQDNKQQPDPPAIPQFFPSTNITFPSTPPLNDNPLVNLPNAPRLDNFSPQIAAWVRMRGAGLARSGDIPSADDMPAYVRKSGGGLFKNLSSSNDGDIMAIAFLVMMEAANAAQEDLKSLMERAKKINDAKARLHRQQDTLRAATDEAAAKGVAPCLIADCNAVERELADATGVRDENSVYRLPVNANQTDIESMLERLKKQEDKKSEMGETTLLQLHMTMDRMTKIEEILSNLLKKKSETKKGSIDNVK